MTVRANNAVISSARFFFGFHTLILDDFASRVCVVSVVLVAVLKIPPIDLCPFAHLFTQESKKINKSINKNKKLQVLFRCSLAEERFIMLVSLFNIKLFSYSAMNTRR